MWNIRRYIDLQVTCISYRNRSLATYIAMQKCLVQSSTIVIFCTNIVCITYLRRFIQLYFDDAKIYNENTCDLLFGPFIVSCINLTLYRYTDYIYWLQQFATYGGCETIQNRIVCLQSTFYLIEKTFCGFSTAILTHGFTQHVHNQLNKV